MKNPLFTIPPKYPSILAKLASKALGIPPINLGSLDQQEEQKNQPSLKSSPYLSSLPQEKRTLKRKKKLSHRTQYNRSSVYKPTLAQLVNASSKPKPN